MTWATVTESLYHKWPQKYSVCRYYNLVISSFMIITRFVTRVTRRVTLVEKEMPTLPKYPSSTIVSLWGSHCSIFSFLCKIVRSLVILLLPLYQCLSFCYFWSLYCLTIYLRCLITPFGVFKLFLHSIWVPKVSYPIWYVFSDETTDNKKKNPSNSIYNSICFRLYINKTSLLRKNHRTWNT
jgi:hypothetical protein